MLQYTTSPLTEYNLQFSEKCVLVLIDHLVFLFFFEFLVFPGST